MEEAKQQYLEVRQKIQQLKGQLGQTDRNRQGFINQGKSAHLTLEEIGPLSDTTRAYRSVGKAYVLSSRKELVDELEATRKHAEEQVKALEEVRDRLAETLKTAEAEAQELQRQIMAQ